MITHISSSSDNILIAGDWHANLSCAKSAIVYAEKHNIDTILQLGDFGVYQATMHNFIDPLSVFAQEHNVHIYFIDGNHEDHSILFPLPHTTHNLRPNLTYLHRNTVFSLHTPTSQTTNRHLRFHALGGAFSIDKFVKPAEYTSPHETISLDDVEKAFLDISPRWVDIMLTHDCPSILPNPVTENELSQGRAALFYSEKALQCSQDNQFVLSIIAQYVLPQKLFHGHFHVYHNTQIEDPIPLTGIGLATDGEANNLYILNTQEELNSYVH